MMNKHKQPPMILVQTWLELLTSSELSAQQHAQKMLTGAFGDMSAALDYIKKHEVEVA